MARTYANDPLQKFKFRVSIPGLSPALGFQKASGLRREVGVVEYREGGHDYTHKLVGQEVVEPVVLERGTYASQDLYQLYKQTLTNPSFRTTVTIEQLDKQGKVARKWVLAEAWVKSWESSDLDAESEDVAIEKIEIEFEYFLD